METEAKYDVSNDGSLPALDSLTQVAGTASEPEDQLEAEYYDTRDLRLLRSGITLRRRRGGADAGWHLKLPVGPRLREEIRLPLGRAGQPVPGELADLVRVRTGGAALVQIATIATRRRSTSLLGASGESLAVVADDSVVARNCAAPEAPSSWREVEVELTGGDRGLLAEADKVLRQHGLQPAAEQAKLERVLGKQLPMAAGRPKMTSSTPAHQVITGYMEKQAEALKSLDPHVRRFRPDAVHQMRLTTRRLRSTLQAFGGIIRRADTQHLADELKWLGTVLGAARDAEVLEEHLRQQQAQTEVAELMGPVQARVRAHFARLEATSRAAVLQALDSARYAALLHDLDEVIRRPPLGPDGRSAAAPALTAAVARAYRRTEQRMRLALQTPPGERKNVALHRARMAAKRARYAAEVAVAVVGRDARRLARQLKRLQDVLGRHQDTVVARQTERRLGISAHLAGESAFSYGLFYGRDECAARLLQSEAEEVWEEVSRPRYRHWLAV